MNYVDKVHKVEDILNNWQKKRLTLPGKITIAIIKNNWSTLCHPLRSRKRNQ